MSKFSLRSIAIALLFSTGIFAQTDVVARNNAAGSPAGTPAPSVEPAAIAPIAPVLPAAEPAPSWKHVPGYLLQDQKAFWTSPFRMSKSDAKWWVIFGAAGAGLVASGDKWIAHNLPNSSGQISAGNWGSKLGTIYTLGGIDAGLYGLGRLRHDDRMQQTSILGAEALGGAFILNTVLKGITQRQRPTEGNGSGSFFSGKGRIWNTGSSFPSGHSMETWALASVIAHQYSQSRIVPVVAYGLATTVSLSRIAVQKHFSSDVVIGAALGYFIGDYVTRHRGGAASSSKIGRVLGHAQMGGSGVGFAGTF
jgi:membrane-associated phospholipid phosphatase